MSPITGFDRDPWWHAASRRGGEPAARGLRALLQALRRWWAKERYRPERRYMRG
jgi:hypothetical protein